MVAKGLVHIYTGNGKGKTTCSLGLAIRAFGAGKKVLFAQFLKGSHSSEVEVLKKLGIQIIRMPDIKKFSWQMNEQEGEDMRQLCNKFFNAIRDEILSGGWDLVVLDEAMGALACGGVCIDSLCALIDEKPETLELVFTGRNAPEALVAKADYVSEINPIKHPMDKGINARRGIEF